MNTGAIPPDGQGNKNSRIDDREAALEESGEQNEENRVVEEAQANQKEFRPIGQKRIDAGFS